MRAGTRFSSTYQTSLVGHTARTTSKRFGFKSMLTAASEESTFRIDYTAKNSYPQSSNCSFPFRSNNDISICISSPSLLVQFHTSKGVDQLGLVVLLIFEAQLSHFRFQLLFERFFHLFCQFGALDLQIFERALFQQLEKRLSQFVVTELYIVQPEPFKDRNFTCTLSQSSTYFEGIDDGAKIIFFDAV